MRAVSFLGPLSVVDECATDLRSKRRLGDERGAWRVAHRAIDAVCDLVELCSVSRPLPTRSVGSSWSEERIGSSWFEGGGVSVGVKEDRKDMDGDGDATEAPADDRTVLDVLRRIDHESCPRVEAHRSTAPPERAVPDRGRIVGVGGYLTVPLADRGPAAANWFVLFRHLSSRIESVAHRCRTVAQRYRLNDERPLAAAWEGTAALLEDLRTFLIDVESTARWTRVPALERTNGHERTGGAARQLLSLSTTDTL